MPRGGDRRSAKRPKYPKGEARKRVDEKNKANRERKWRENLEASRRRDG